MLIGAGVGAVVGFVTFALVEMVNPSDGGLLILMPSGPLGVGILGAVMMGLVGVVIGQTCLVHVLSDNFKSRDRGAT